MMGCITRGKIKEIKRDGGCGSRHIWLAEGCTVEAIYRCGDDLPDRITIRWPDGAKGQYKRADQK